MQILRDDQRIARLRKVAQYVSFAGIAILLGGLAIIFWGNENALLIQLAALGIGWLVSQVGMFLSHRYVRQPRADEVLDEALKHVARDGRLYHYLLPAPHVLLLPSGFIILHAKYQNGSISADGDKWKQTGVGLRKYFGQEGLGNPTKEVERLVSSMGNYVRKYAPQIEEVPVAPIIVFTTKNVKDLDVKKSRIPAMHYSKLKGFMRQKGDSLPALSPETYHALREAFDRKAAKLIEEADGNLA